MLIYTIVGYGIPIAGLILFFILMAIVEGWRFALSIFAATLVVVVLVGISNYCIAMIKLTA